MTVSLVLPLRSGPASAASDGLRSGSIGGMVKLPRHAEVMFSRQVWGLDCERPLLLETLATWIGPVYEWLSFQECKLAPTRTTIRHNIYVRAYMHSPQRCVGAIMGRRAWSGLASPCDCRMAADGKARAQARSAAARRMAMRRPMDGEERPPAVESKGPLQEMSPLARGCASLSKRWPSALRDWRCIRCGSLRVVWRP